MSYSKLLKEIMYDEDNISYTEKGIKPLFSAPETAQIIIIAQAPGIRAQELYLTKIKNSDIIVL